MEGAPVQVTSKGLSGSDFGSALSRGLGWDCCELKQTSAIDKQPPMESRKHAQDRKDGKDIVELEELVGTCLCYIDTWGERPSLSATATCFLNNLIFKLKTVNH